MSEMAQNPIAEKLQSATAELMKQKSDLSEQMAIDCIMQAIKCGDFTRLLQGDKEGYVYIPFQRERELQQKINDVQQRRSDERKRLARFERERRMGLKIANVMLESVSRNVRGEQWHETLEKAAGELKQ